MPKPRSTATDFHSKHWKSWPVASVLCDAGWLQMTVSRLKWCFTRGVSFIVVRHRQKWASRCGYDHTARKRKAAQNKVDHSFTSSPSPAGPKMTAPSPPRRDTAWELEDYPFYAEFVYRVEDKAVLKINSLQGHSVACQNTTNPKRRWTCWRKGPGK
jgi:hypothetical protein